MKKLPYIRQGQQLTIDILNGIIKAINSSILERKEYDSMMADITRMFNSYQSKVDNFILKYQDVVDNTPGLMDLLQSYSTLASMVNGTYVASVGSVNITAAGFNIQRTMGRVQFEDERNYARTYPQYSSLLITELGGATTLVYNVAPFESTPIWIEMEAIAGPQGPPGPQGIPGPRGENGEDGEPGQITSIKGKKASLEECLSLDVAPRSGDAYVVDNGDDGITLYVYFDEDLAHTDPNSWVSLNNIRGPAGPQGEMAEIRIQYSNYADGSHASDVYEGHSFMIISEDGGSTRHVIKLAPKVTFRIVDIEEKTTATTPSADVSTIDYPETNEKIINTKITIPYLRTVESASLVGNNLHLKYRGIEGTTPVGRVVYDPAKIIFTDGISGLNIGTLKEGDVIIDVSDNYKIFNYIEDDFVPKGYLQGPQGPAGPVGTSFNLIGEWVTYGNTSNGAVTASAGNVGRAYFLPADDGNHPPGIYVSSEVSPGDYEWVFAGNSQGPKGETGAKGDPGPRGTRITAGEDFYFDGADLIVPNNTGNTYKQNDLYLNTTSWDLFQVTAIGADPSYTISAVLIGNIKGLGITNITVDQAAENLTVTYSGGSTTVVPIRTIRVADTEYDKAGLVVHKTDTSAKGVFVVEQIGTQSDPDDPVSFQIWGNATDLQAPSGTTGSAGDSTLIPRADHVHPAPEATTEANGLMSSADKIKLNGIAPGASAVTIETSQSTSAVKVPSSNLLKESSFARVIRAVTELGLTYPCTTTDILNALYTGAYVNTIVIIGLATSASASITDLPDNFGTLLIHLGSERLRWVVEWHGNKKGTGADRFYVGKISRSANTVIGVAWSEVIDSSSAQTISGVKTYSVSPLVPTTPSGASAAVNKTYVTVPPDDITMTKAAPQYNLKNTDIVVGGTLPTANKYSTFGFLDNSNTNCGYTQYRYFPNGTIEILIACNSHNTPNSRTVGVAIGTDISNNTYFRSNNDGQTDLGRSTLKWKDIHFSGALKKNGTDINALDETITGIKTFATGATPLITDQPTTDLMAVNKAYVDSLHSVYDVDSLHSVYDKVIKTQAEFEDMIADGLELNNTNIQNSTWRGAKSVALIGDHFTLSYTDNRGVKIPQNVKQIHGFNSAKITVTNFKYDVNIAKGGLWYETAPTTLDYSIRDLEVSCTGRTGSGRAFYNCSNLSNCTGTATGTSGYGFSSCNNLSNCTGSGTGTGTEAYSFGFSNCNNLSNCTGTGTATKGYGFYIINYAVNCKDGGSSIDMWYGTNKNIDIDTCRRTPVEVTAAELTALNT